MKINKPAFAAFVSALTDADQLSVSERKRAASNKAREDKAAIRDARHRTWLTAEAAYHRAYAGHWEVLRARHYSRRDRSKAEAEHAEACRLLTDAVEDFMAIPFQNDGDPKERVVLILKWGKALCTSPTRHAWLAARQDWLSKIGDAA